MLGTREAFIYLLQIYAKATQAAAVVICEKCTAQGWRYVMTISHGIRIWQSCACNHNTYSVRELTLLTHSLAGGANCVFMLYNRVLIMLEGDVWCDTVK